MRFKIKQDMIFQEVFLFNHIHYRQCFQLPEMRPAFIVSALQFIVTALCKKRTNGDVHQVLLLLLGEFLAEIPEFLYTDKEENGLHIRLLSESLHQFGFQVPPATL